MDTNDRENDRPMRIDKDAQINVVLNNPAAANGVIDLGRVIENFKEKKRIYAWVTLLFFAAGILASMLWYQHTESPASVTSVVTLEYEIPNPLLDPLNNPDYSPSLLEDDNIPRFVKVPDLTAPDGSELDLGKISSSYVLKKALDGMNLSRSVSLTNLANSIRIERILSQESKRMQEIASGMIQEKSTSTYTQIQKVHLTYENRFVVTLTNGFAKGSSRDKRNLPNNELRMLLDRILTAYNDYLVDTYADRALPEDAFSVIDAQTKDIPECLDMLRAAADSLCDYCSDRPDKVRAYRSWETGNTLDDLLAHLEQLRDNDVDYLYASVLTNNVARDPAAMRMGFQYRLRNAQVRLDQVNEDIENTQRILDSYKNDEIYITMQDSGDTKTTTSATGNYNNLVLQQAENYSEAEKLSADIANLENRIALIDTDADVADIKPYREELERVIERCKDCYSRISAQMQEIQRSPFFTTYLQHSTTAVSSNGFIAGAGKKMALGGVAGLFIGLGFWFLAALAPEYRPGKKQPRNAEEVAEQ